MWKKSAVTAGIFCLVIGLGVVTIDRPPANFFPELPFQSASKQSVLSVLQLAENQVKWVAEEAGYHWYGTAAPQVVAADHLKTVMAKAGWTFVRQEGAGYFFEKGSEKSIITSQMWTGHYVLFKVPASLPLLSVSTVYSVKKE